GPESNTASQHHNNTVVPGEKIRGRVEENAGKTKKSNRKRKRNGTPPNKKAPPRRRRSMPGEPAPALDETSAAEGLRVLEEPDHARVAERMVRDRGQHVGGHRQDVRAGEQALG